MVKVKQLQALLATRPAAAPALVMFVLVLLTALVVGCVPAQSPPPQSGPSVVAGPASPSAAAQSSPAAPRSGNAHEVILATTTSTQDSGLLDVLVPMFEKSSGYAVKTISVGTGAALALGARGEADVVLVHAPGSELQWMQQGNGTERLLVMHNDFLIVGPQADPAQIRGKTSAVEALQTVAASDAPFVSRGDNSGTHQLELGLWKKSGIDPKDQPWYIQSGTGMGQTLTIADQKGAYTIADRATWLAYSTKVQLPTMVERDPVLLNVYHVMPVNPSKFPGVPVNAAGGSAFAHFMVAPDTQSVIGSFGTDKYGQSLFVPDAGKAEADVGL